jgi:hypothetical protein
MLHMVSAASPVLYVDDQHRKLRKVASLPAPDRAESAKWSLPITTTRAIWHTRLSPALGDTPTADIFLHTTSGKCFPPEPIRIAPDRVAWRGADANLRPRGAAGVPGELDQCAFEGPTYPRGCKGQRRRGSRDVVDGARDDRLRHAHGVEQLCRDLAPRSGHLEARYGQDVGESQVVAERVERKRRKYAERSFIDDMGDA